MGAAIPTAPKLTKQLASVTLDPLTPTRKMPGEMLLERGRPDEALKASRPRWSRSPIASGRSVARPSRRNGEGPRDHGHFRKLLAMIPNGYSWSRCASKFGIEDIQSKLSDRTTRPLTPDPWWPR